MTRTLRAMGRFLSRSTPRLFASNKGSRPRYSWEVWEIGSAASLRCPWTQMTTFTSSKEDREAFCENENMSVESLPSREVERRSATLGASRRLRLTSRL